MPTADNNSTGVAADHQQTAIDANRKLRARIERAVEKLIVALDLLDAPVEDLEDTADTEPDDGDPEPDADGEPSLGSIGVHSPDQSRWSAGGADDFEVDDADDEDDCTAEEAEPSGIGDSDGLVEQCPDLYPHGIGWSTPVE